MSIRVPLPIAAALMLAAVLVTPAFAQFRPRGDVDVTEESRDEAAILRMLSAYEDAFNRRDMELRMSLCLDTYWEYGFENGEFLQARDFDDTRREVGRYWASISALNYSIDEIDITIDGPQAFVRAYTTHIARGERHSSIVHFNLVKIEGRWYIAWDSYNIVRKYD